MIKKIHQKIKQKEKVVTFLICVACTIVLWFVQTMSDTYVYEKTYPVRYSGYNKNMYTYIKSDSVLSVSMRSTGFQYLYSVWIRSNKTIDIDVNNCASYSNEENLVYSFSLRDNKDIKNQITSSRKIETNFMIDSISLVLSPLAHKKVKIQLVDVDFLFDTQYELYGTPSLHPDSVEVYGSESDLKNITHVNTKGRKIKNINKTDYYNLDLCSPTNYGGDIRLSTDKVKIYLPVEKHTEKRLVLPVNIPKMDSTTQVRLYPETVELLLDVAVKDYKKITAEQFDITVKYNKNSPHSLLDVVLAEYPSNVKIKKITPEQIQYVIIK